MSQNFIFRAGPNAPAPEQALGGVPIPNHINNFQLAGFVADPTDSESRVELDTSVHPPVLRLVGALATATHGYLNSHDEFVAHEGDEHRDTYRVTGDYTGPDCELDCEEFTGQRRNH